MKIALISMPFARLDLPSLALTQLKSVLIENFGDKLDVQLLYLNHDFSSHLELDTYKIFTGKSVYVQKRAAHSGEKSEEDGLKKTRTFEGVGEWLFRPYAFPGAKDNSDEYFPLYLKKELRLIEKIKELQQNLPAILSEMIAKYNLCSYDVLCFTSMFQQQNANFALINLVKKRNPHSKVIVGGSNLDETADAFADNFPLVDYYIKGPGYDCVLKIVTEMLEKEDRTAQAGKIRQGKERDINQVIPLDYRDFHSAVQNNKKHRKSLYPAIFFETSRGCWWGEKHKCTFCDYNKTEIGFRAMEPNKAIAYIQGILDGNKKDCSYFWAVDSIMPLEYINQVFPYLAVPEHVKIFYETRAGMSRGQLRQLAYAHISMIQTGIEALDTATLKRLNKGTSAADNLFFLKSCCEERISVLWNLLCGIPGEDIARYESLLALLPRLYHLYPPTGLWPISYDKNSEYVRKQAAYGLCLSPQIRVLKYQFPFDKKTLESMAYFFENQANGSLFPLEKIKLIEKINTKIKYWQTRWNGSDIPQLYLTKNNAEESTVVDTRGDTPWTISIDRDTNALLLYLHKPRTYLQIKKRFSNLDADLLLKNCRQNNLIWVEAGQDRYVSLVLERKTIAPKLCWSWE